MNLSLSTKKENYRDLINDIDSRTKFLMKKHDIVGYSLALIRDGEIIWAKGYGIRNKEKQLSVTEETVFEAASLTKPLVAYAALKMVEEGLLELDKSLITYLENPYLENQPLQDQITARHVLTHSTGFPNWGKVRYSPKIFFTPGERFSYSGEGFMYLQKVMEIITGKSLEAIIQEKVLKPLGLVNATLLWKEEYEETAAEGYFKDGSLKNKWKPKKEEAAGSLSISPTDYARFVISLMDQSKKSESLLSNEKIEEMLKPAIPVNDAGLSNKYKVPYSEITESDSAFWGLGIGLEKIGKDYNFWHWGNNTSFQNLVLANPKNKSGMVIMSNSEKAPLIWKELLNLTMKGEHPGFDWLMSFYWD